MRSLAALLGLCFTAVFSACNADDSSASSSQSPLPPASCGPQPCSPGKVCLGAAENACDGTWYCWSDAHWYCAPPDSGGPGGPPDASATPPDAPTEAAPADAAGG